MTKIHYLISIPTEHLMIKKINKQIKLHNNSSNNNKISNFSKPLKNLQNKIKINYNSKII